MIKFDKVDQDEDKAKDEIEVIWQVILWKTKLMNLYL